MIKNMCKDKKCVAHKNTLCHGQPMNTVNPFATQLHQARLTAGDEGKPVSQKRMVEILNKRINNPLLTLTQLKYHRWENGKVTPAAKVQDLVLKAINNK